ncbi:MAG: siderophore-interacting protein [Pseudomonadota bacterium]
MTFAAHAHLPLPFDQLRDWLLAAPVFAESGRQESDGSLHVTFEVGVLRVRPADGISALALDCGDAQGLQALRDFVTEAAVAEGITPIWTERHSRGRPANLCVARVMRVDRISPAFRRVWIRHRDLANLLRGGLHFRLLFGPQDADWPWLDETGVTNWPGGIGAWHRPVYTVRSIAQDGDSTIVSFDIFLHDGGRVTRWSDHLQHGAEVGIMGPSGGDLLTSAAATPWFGLFGDETALPAIARLLATLPASAIGQAVIAIPQTADRQQLAHPPGITLTWAIRGSTAPLIDMLQAATPPARDRFIFFAASSSETAQARDVIRAKGLDRAEFRAQSYWKPPAADQPA